METIVKWAKAENPETPGKILCMDTIEGGFLQFLKMPFDTFPYVIRFESTEASNKNWVTQRLSYKEATELYKEQVLSSLC